MPARKPQERMPAEVRRLVKRLGANMIEERVRAIVALGRIGHGSATPHVARALTTIPLDWVAYNTAADTLMKLASEKHGRQILKAFKKEPFINLKMLRILGKSGTPEAAPYIEEWLQRTTQNWSAYRPEHQNEIRDTSLKALYDIAARNKEALEEHPTLKASFLVYPNLRKNGDKITEDSKLIGKALEAAKKGKIDERNARLYLKQLRAMEGSVK